MAEACAKVVYTFVEKTVKPERGKGTFLFKTR